MTHTHITFLDHPHEGTPDERADLYFQFKMGKEYDKTAKVTKIIDHGNKGLAVVQTVEEEE